MRKRDVETFYHNGRWHNRIEGRVEVLFSHDTQDEAVTEGRELARHLQGQHLIRDNEPDDMDTDRLVG